MIILSNIKPIWCIKQFFHLMREGDFRKPWFQLFLCLVIIGTHWTYLEGWSGVSYIKIAYMCLCGLMLLGLKERINKVVIITVGIFYTCVLLSAYVFSDAEFSMTSIIYMLMYLVTYSYYISLLYSQAITYELAVRFLRGMILAYFFFIVLQQLTASINLRVPLLNCHGFIWGWKFPGMNIEPSHCSRLLATIFLVYIEMLNLQNSTAISFGYLWKNERIALLAFIYSMCTMGSGMGVAALIIILLYVLCHTHNKSIFVAVPILVFIFYLIYETESFTRLFETYKATLTMDEKAIMTADSSAAARVNVILGTFKNISLSDYNFWFGYGIESGINMTGILVIYGAIAFIAQIILFRIFAWRSFISIDFLFFFVFNGMAVGNVAYVWAMIMYWSMLKYFVTMQERKSIIYGRY